MRDLRAIKREGGRGKESEIRTTRESARASGRGGESACHIDFRAQVCETGSRRKQGGVDQTCRKYAAN